MIPRYFDLYQSAKLINFKYTDQNNTENNKELTDSKSSKVLV